jgi:hypothetical protein
MNNFEDALNAAATFSEDANLVYWSDQFAEVVEHLHDPEPAIPYHPELLPPTFDALICRQLLAGACKAWVFGGMGSWNDDVGCQSPENHAISSRLYQALMCAIAAATNSNGERSPAAASAVTPDATRSSEHKIAPVRDMAYWLRRLQGDRCAEAVQGLVQFGAPGIAELLSSMERSYARVDEILKEALRHVDAQAMLLELVRHENGFVRAQVLVLLAELAAGDPAVTEASRKALHDPDERVRTVAIQSLRKSGPHAGDVVPDLVALMQKDTSDSVCIEAMRALADISPAGAAALRQAQEDDDPRMRDLYADAFRKRSRRQQNQRE